MESVMRQLCALWNDERGFILSAELVLIATLCVIGLITGLTLVRDSVAGEFGDIAAAMRSLDQSYSYSGFRAYKTNRCGGCKAYTAGSCFNQKGEQCEADIVSFGTCTPTVVAPVVTPVCPPVAPPVVPCPPVRVESVPCPPPAVESIPCPPAPVYCPPAPTYCPPVLPVCPPLYVPQ